MERKIAGERCERECGRGEIGGRGEEILIGFFKNILNVFCFLSLRLPFGRHLTRQREACKTKS
jgi:hypothetical protein